jgi:hypothetical protein
LPTLWAAQESGKGPRASLQVVIHPPRVSFSTAEDRGDYPRHLNTQVALIRSRFVLNAALRDRGVSQLPPLKERTDPITWLQQSLEVTNPKDSEILQISLAPGSGLSGADQATIINAVVRAYMDEVVNVDLKRRTERYDRLKKLQDNYDQLLSKKQETLRKLSESAGRGEPLGDLEKNALRRLYHDLRTRRVKLRLEQAEAETLLARRKKAEGSATDPARKEMAQLEDRLAVVIAGQKVVDEELERLTHEVHRAAIQDLDLKELKDDMAQMEDAARKVAAEVEALIVELEGPPRIRVIEVAVPIGS